MKSEEEITDISVKKRKLEEQDSADIKPRSKPKRKSKAKKEISIESDEEIEQVANKSKKKRKKKKRSEHSQQETSKDKSHRRLKREKQAVREAEIIVTKQLQTTKDAHDYLVQWKNDHSSWKFMKAKQIWLHNHKFDKEKVSDDIWPVFIEYFASAKGNAKTLLLEDSKKIIANMEQWVEKHGDDDEKNKQDEDNSENERDASENEDSKPSELCYRRARSIIQNIQE